jgi:hypothetical protein
MHGEKQMKQLWTGNDPVLMSMLRPELNARGIAFTVRNEALGVAMGELPPIDIWPELWVIEDARFGEAEAILRDLQAEGTNG